MEEEHTPDFEWNDIYQGNTDDYMEPDLMIFETAQSLPKGRVLDVGCGAGGLLAALAKEGWKVAGIDIAPKAISAARKVLADRDLHGELEVADAASWHSDEQYDLITSSFALPNTREDQQTLFSKMRQWLAPGGSIIIKDFDASMKRHKVFERFHCPTLDELVQSFADLEIQRAEIVDTPAHNHGDGHGHQSDGLEDHRSAAFLHAKCPRPQ